VGSDVWKQWCGCCEFFLCLFLSKSTSIYRNNEECEYIYMNFQFVSTVRLYSIWNLDPQIFLLFKHCSSPKGYVIALNSEEKWLYALKNLLAKSSDWQNPQATVFLFENWNGKEGRHGCCFPVVLFLFLIIIIIVVMVIIIIIKKTMRKKNRRGGNAATTCCSMVFLFIFIFFCFNNNNN
jgi:hypothetical protein